MFFVQSVQDRRCSPIHCNRPLIPPWKTICILTVWNLLELEDDLINTNYVSLLRQHWRSSTVHLPHPMYLLLVSGPQRVLVRQASGWNTSQMDCYSQYFVPVDGVCVTAMRYFRATLSRFQSHSPEGKWGTERWMLWNHSLGARCRPYQTRAYRQFSQERDTVPPNQIHIHPLWDGGRMGFHRSSPGPIPSVK